TEGGVTSVAQRATTLEARADSLETGLSGTTTALDALTTRVTANESGITSVSQRATTLEARADSLETGLSGTTTALDTLTTRVTTAESGVTSVAQRATTLEARADSLETGLSGTTTALDTLTTRVTTAESGITSVAQRASTLEARADNLETGLSGTTDALDTLTTRVTTAEGGITSVAQRASTLEARADSLETGLSGTADALDAVGARVTATEDSIEVIAGRAEVLEAAIGGQQVLPNGDFAAGDLRGWKYVPAGWEVIQRGSTAAAAVVNAPRLFVLSIDEDVAHSQAQAVGGISVKPGEKFTVSLWGATRASGTAVAAVRFAWISAAGEPLGTITTTNFTFSDATWQQVSLNPVLVPDGAASVDIKVRRDGGGYGKLYLASVRVERIAAATADALARVETIEGTYVDADGAVAAVEQTISADYETLEAMAQATSFAKATADGISAGFVWRLNGENLIELVSVTEGTDGPVSTYKIAADYVKITGLTQIDTAVITELAADEAFLDHLVVTRGEIVDVLQSDNFVAGEQGLKLDFATGNVELNHLRVRGDMIIDGEVTTDKLGAGAVSNQEYVFAESYAGPVEISLDRAVGVDTRLDVSLYMMDQGGLLLVSLMIERKIGTGSWIEIHSRPLGCSPDGSTISFAFVDTNVAGGLTQYRISLLFNGYPFPDGQTVPGIGYFGIFATQLKR
ncbi:MAG: hypothetical protein AB7S99_00625, partial [Pseudodonghicola sp.]